VAGLDDEGFAIIERFSVVPTRGDVCVGGKIRNQTIVAQAVKKALKNVGAKSGSVVVGLSAAEQGIARVALPVAVKAQERLGAIRTMGVQVASTVPTRLLQ
jgi:Tfp pilus assembly PilM family ATPase